MVSVPRCKGGSVSLDLLGMPIAYPLFLRRLIFFFQLRVCFENLLCGHARRNLLEDHGNRYPHSPNGRLAEAYLGIDGDTV